MMDVPRYAREQVEQWENSALDSRIYLVEAGYPTTPQKPTRDDKPVNTIEGKSCAGSDSGTQVT
jgi:hypothetical protein